jgi:hypothetical protein
MLLLLGAGLATAQTVNIAGTYRCASFNVGGRGGRCTSPPLILRGDGTYQISGEKGPYGVKNGLLVLSASKVPGPGQILGNEIMFEYRYAGLLQTVTYRRSPDATVTAASAASSPESLVPVDLTIVFPTSDGWIDSVNSARLVAPGSDPRSAATALAYSQDRRTVRAYFRGIKTRIVYELQLGSGFANYAMASLDLRAAHGQVQRTLEVPLPGKAQER